MASSSKKRTAEAAAAAAANDEQGDIHFASLRFAIGNCRARTGAVFRLTICPAARVLARAEKPGRADLQELERDTTSSETNRRRIKRQFLGK